MGRQPTQHRRPKSAADPLDTVGWRALQLEFVGWRALPLWAGEPRHCGLESPKGFDVCSCGLESPKSKEVHTQTTRVFVFFVLENFEIKMDSLGSTRSLNIFRDWNGLASPQKHKLN